MGVSAPAAVGETPATKSWRARLGSTLLFALGVSLASVLTVLRYSVCNQADTLMNSLMSVQRVTLFFWGQDRLPSLVPLLFSPIADPRVNLVACLLFNATAFHLFLLTLAFMGARVVSGGRSAAVVGALFAVMVLVSNVVMEFGALHGRALDTQPYALSYTLSMWSFLLWGQGGWWRRCIAAVFVGMSAGLNPIGIVVIGALAATQFVRSRKWWSWTAYGSVWVAWIAIWMYLSANHGQHEPSTGYLTLSLDQLIQHWPESLAHIAGAFSAGGFVAVAIVSALAFVLLPSERRWALALRGTWAAMFCLMFWAVFTANTWLAVNAFHERYYTPLYFSAVVVLSAPLVALTVDLRTVVARFRAGPVPGTLGCSRRVSLLLAGVTLCYAGIVGTGPLGLPSAQPVFADVQATVNYAKANGIRLISGDYWAVVPITLRLLESGRTAAFGISQKSGGDPASYRAVFEAEQERTGGAARALCVNADVQTCVSYLNSWLPPGWVDAGETCPAPAWDWQLGPLTRSCLILVHTPEGG